MDARDRGAILDLIRNLANLTKRVEALEPKAPGEPPAMVRRGISDYELRFGDRQFAVVSLSNQRNEVQVSDFDLGGRSDVSEVPIDDAIAQVEALRSALWWLKAGNR